jgi:hypothetical protein
VTLRRSDQASVYATGRRGKAVDRRRETALSWPWRESAGGCEVGHLGREICDKSSMKVINERFWAPGPCVTEARPATMT